MASVRLDRRAIDALVTSPSSPVRLSVERATTRVANQAKRNLTSGSTRAVDTGRLRASIKTEVRAEGRKVVGRIGTDLEYALYVHQGTGLGRPSPFGGPPPSGRVIKPRRARFLRFETGRGFTPHSNGFTFAKSVRGQDAKPFLAKALEDLTGRGLFG